MSDSETKINPLFDESLSLHITFLLTSPIIGNDITDVNMEDIVRLSPISQSSAVQDPPIKQQTVIHH